MRNKELRNTRLSSFSRLLFAEWRKQRLPISDSSVIVAVSGGADSTALMLGLEELIKAGRLNVNIIVAHLDHGLRTASKKDAKWVSELAKKLGFEVVIGRAKVAERARESGDNLEQAARKARYEFLERTAKRKKSDFVLSAHTMDDQAETVLLRLMRGSAGAGLRGVESNRPISTKSKVHLVRPLLWARRSHTEDYCRFRKTDFLHDEMNDNEQFSRVKVRKQLLPLMTTFNAKVVEALSRTATLLGDDEDVLATRAYELLERASEDSSPGSPALNVQILKDAPTSLRRRALKEWISNARGNSRRIEMVHLLAVEKLLEGNKGGRVVELPNGSRVLRKRGWIEFDAEN